MVAAAPMMIASLVISAAQTVISAKQASAQRKHQAAQVAQQQQHAALQQRINERNLERKRKQDMSSARARLSASGAGSDDGSGATVLRGLNTAFDRQLSDGRALYRSQLAGSQNLLNNKYDGLQSALSFGQQMLGIGNQVVGLVQDGSETASARPASVKSARRQNYTSPTPNPHTR